MADPIKFVFDVNLDQNELQQAVLHKINTTPPTPVEGQVYYDTILKTIGYYNGTIFKYLDSNAITTINGTAPISAVTVGQTTTISVSDATTSVKGVIQIGGDLSGNATSQTVVTVGGSSAANIADAASKRHSQNTDTGTTQDSFQIGSAANGPRLKNVGGELEARNYDDTDYANFTCKNLRVLGTYSIIKSNEVYIGDNSVILNGEIDISTSNSDGGIEVKRIKNDAAGTGTITGTDVNIVGVGTSFTSFSVGDVIVFGAQRRIISAIADDTHLTVETAFAPQPSGDNFSVAQQSNAAVTFDTSTNRWEATHGTVTNPQSHQLSMKFAQNVGNGTDTVFAITHNLNSQDVNVFVRETASPYAQVIPSVEITSANVVTLTFKKVPTSNQYRVVIQG